MLRYKYFLRKKALLIDTISKRKALKILLTLNKGAKCIKEIQEAVGGSYTTINKRIEELVKAGLAVEEYLTGEEFGIVPRNKRWIRITDKGRKIVQSLLDSNIIKMPSLRLDRQKWIILILHRLGPIRGRTRLMKLLFIWRRESGFGRGNYYKFEAGKYGPFSKDIITDTEELENNGFISIEKVDFPKNEFSEDETTLYVYTLTPKGGSVIPEISSDLPEGLMKRIEILLKPYREMPLLKLLRYVYERYPKFIRNSLIVEKILKEWD